MKFKKSPIILGLISFLSLVGCGNTEHSSSSESSVSSQSEISQSTSQSQHEKFDLTKVVAKEGYLCGINEGDNFSGTLPITVSSLKEDDKLQVYIDGKEIEDYKEKSTTIKATVTYEYDPEHPVNTESVEHSDNTVKLNGTYMDLLHNEEGVETTLKPSRFKLGQNILNITIGYVYMHQAFDKNNVRYKLGWGADFRIRKVGIQLSNGTYIKPSKMVGYYCDENVKKSVKEEMSVDPDQFYWMGDGWGDGAYLARINHTDPEYYRPFSIDYYFDYTPTETNINYKYDSKLLIDGQHTITATSNGEVVYQKHFIADNSKPSVSCNINDGDYINKDFVFSYNAEDSTSGIETTQIKLDGNVVSKVNLTSLDYGPHSITLNTVDKSGNSKAETVCFNLVKDAYNLTCQSTEGNKIKISAPYSSEFNVNEYEKNTLSVTSEDNETFKVHADSTAKNVIIDYSCEIQKGEKVLLEAFNTKTKLYEKVYLSNNGKAKFELKPTNYVDNNNDILIRATLNKVDNGSNRIIWASDIQYLAKNESNYQDIKEYYNTLTQYMADEYTNGRANYVINTGDTVDDTPDYGTAADKEWQHASTAWDKLDDVGMPYGVVAGNHCVGTKYDYSYYQKYFGNKRNGNELYFGESLNNAECHYDLITVGEFDFVIIYLGYGVEATPETVEWANKVLKTYSHRNAIIATHCYLDENAQHDVTGRADAILEQIVTPNSNVKMVLCGHTDQSAYVKKQIGDRDFYEIISCFQFVETESDGTPIAQTNHVTNGYKCNGEGWIKDIVINEDGTMSFHTFSPVLGKDSFSTTTNPEKYYEPDFSIKVDLVKNNTQISNAKLNAYQLGDCIGSKTTTGTYSRVSEDSIIYVVDAMDAKGIFF